MSPPSPAFEEMLRLSYPGRSPWLSSPSISPDGRRVVYSAQGEVRSVGVAGGGGIFLHSGASPCYSPADDRVAFVHGAPPQVWLHDPDRGCVQLTQLSHGVCSGPLWSPDGKSLVVIVPTVPSTPTEGSTVAVEVHRPTPSPPKRLCVIDASDGRVREAARSPMDVDWMWPAWSPDGTRIALVENWLTATGGQEQMQLLVLDLLTGELWYPLGRGKRQIGAPRWSPDGTRLALPYSPHDFVHPYRFAGAVVPAAGGEPELLLEEHWVSALFWHPDGDRLFCIVRAGVTGHVVEYCLATGKTHPLTHGPSVHHACRVSPNGSYLVCARSGLVSLPELRWISTETPEQRCLAALPEVALAIQPASVVEWESPGVGRLQGILVRPFGDPPPGGYPTVVELHEGPTGGLGTEFLPEWHWLAAQGLQVFVPSFSGGQVNHWQPPPTVEQDFRDVLSGVDALVERGVANPAALGLRGFSYGAFLGCWLLGHTDRFGAAVLEGGSYDLAVAFGAFPRGGHRSLNGVLQGEMGGTPWEQPDACRHFSPISYAHRITTPTLLLQGEADQTVQSSLLYARLRHTGTEVEYVIYPGVGHGLTDPAHRRDAWERTLRWFRRLHL